MFLGCFQKIAKVKSWEKDYSTDLYRLYLREYSILETKDDAMTQLSS
jgi:hypothetical protein